MKRSPTVACFAIVLAGLVVFADCTSSFDISTGSISLSSVSFRKTSAEYPALRPQAVTVTNTGAARAVGLLLGGANASSFTLSAASVSAPANGEATFTVIPNTGLAQGTYTATVTATATGVEPAVTSVSFEVDAATASNPDPDFHIYLAFGQSNMQGPGAVEDIDRAKNNRFFILNVVADSYNKEQRAKGKWYYATSPLIIPGYDTLNYLGLHIGLSPVDNFGRVLADNTPDTTRIGVIAVANGDTGLAAFAKDINTVNAYNNGSASTTAKEGIKRYKDAGYTQYGGYAYSALIENAKIAQRYGVVKGIIVHQGESGVDNTANGSSWATLFKLIYDDMLFDMGLADNSIPILAGRTFGNSAGNTGGALSANTISDVPNSAVIATSGLANRGDSVHFSNVGIRELGSRYAQWMIDYYHYSPNSGGQ